jgi:hypothetical protein
VEVGEAAVAGLAADREALDAAVLVAREGRVLFLSTADRTAAVAAAVAAVVAAFPGVRSLLVGIGVRAREARLSGDSVRGGGVSGCDQRGERTLD